jgi:hypothetical protein
MPKYSREILLRLWSYQGIVLEKNPDNNKMAEQINLAQAIAKMYFVANCGCLTYRHCDCPGSGHYCLHFKCLSPLGVYR